MTITSPTSSVYYYGNGTNTSFGFPFVISQAADLHVWLLDPSGNVTALTQGLGPTQYSIQTPITYPSSGTITYPGSGGTALPSGWQIVLKQQVQLVQTFHPTNQGPFLAGTYENAYDYLMMAIQEVAETAGRSIQVAPTDGPTIALPSALKRANQVLGFDSSGNPAVLPTVSTPSTVPVSAAVQPALNASTTALALALLGAAPTFTTITNLRNNGLTTAPPIAFVTGYYAANDGGGNIFAYVASDTTSADNGGTIIVDTSNRRWYAVVTLANVRTFGARGDGVTDDTNSIQNALNSGLTVYLPKPAVSYLVKSALTCTTNGQIIVGDGIGQTLIQVNTTFAAGQNGVFIINNPDILRGPDFRDFEMSFTQPDTTVAASMNSYPPAFYVLSKGAKMTRLRIVGANTCVLHSGVSPTVGPLTVADCTLSPLGSSAIGVSSSSTSVLVAITNVNLNGDALTTNQLSVFQASTTTGLSIGGCQQLNLTGGVFNCGTGISFFSGANPIANASITNATFSTNSNLAINNHTAFVMVNASTFTGNATSPSSVVVKDGRLRIVNSQFSVSGSTALANPQIAFTPNTSTPNGVIISQISACIFDNVGDMTDISFGSTTVGTFVDLTVTGCVFNTPSPGIAKAKPSITSSSGGNTRLSVSGSVWAGSGGQTSVVISLPADGAHNLVGNALQGWTISLPGTHTQLVSANNN